MWIDETFPLLDQDGYSVTSPPSEEYNCIAWAVGDDTAWWSYLPGYKWTADRIPEVESLISVFEKLGYEICEGDDVEPGYEKVALYAMGNDWTHASRQLPDGNWTSKLGADEDIEHVSLTGLSGDFYGDVHCIMRRPDQLNFFEEGPD